MKDSSISKQRRTSISAAARILLVGILCLAGIAKAQDDRPTTSGSVASRLEKSGLTPADLTHGYSQPLQPEDVQIVALREVVLQTLSNNLDIDISRLQRGVSTDEIMLQLGIYDPVLAVSAVRTRTDVLTAREPVSFQNFTIDNRSHVNNDLFESSLQQLTPLGSVFTVSYLHSNTGVRDESRTSLITPFYEQQVQLEVVQPLLKNFGPTVTNAGIRIARHQEEFSRYGVLAEIDTQVARAMQIYWDLVFTIENLSVQQLFLKQAEDLLRINRIKFETGVLSQTDVLQAEAQVATGQERVIVAQSAIIAVQDQLKRLMDPTRDLSDWNRPLVPEDLPEEVPFEIDEEEAIQDALANRPEILQSEEQIRIAEIGRSVAEWQRLPELNVFGGYNINGGGPTSGDAWDTVEDNNFNSYQAGVELRYPLLNRRARAEYQQSQKQLEIARKSLENLESVVTVEVRNALRELRTGRERIQATRSAVESEKAKLDAELKRYDVGMSTSFEVLTFQQDLADARVSHLSSLVRYNKALIELDRVRSRLRDRLLEMGVPVELLRTRTEGSSYDMNSDNDPMNEPRP